MPVYEYQCAACGHEFEREQRISEEPVKKCPSCGKAKAKRLISRTSFVLKGGGWYGDLYASQKPGGEKKEAASGEAPAASAENTSATSGESTAAKTDSKSDGKSDGPKPGKKSKGKKAAA